MASATSPANRRNKRALGLIEIAEKALRVTAATRKKRMI
jgi:hypothetical protein